MSNFRFTDEATSSKYTCIVCYTVPGTLLRAQCCGAVYCLQCGEQARQSVTNSPQASVCANCASESLQLYHDALLQENVNKLQVECLHSGCGWRGELGNSRVHMAESHNGVCIAINTETAHPEQALAEQHHTPALSAQPPTVDDFLQDDESSFTSIDTQPPAGQGKQEQLQSIPKQDSLCQRLCNCNCCRNSEFADLNTVEKLLHVIGIFTSVLWMILVLSTSIIALITSIDTVKDVKISFALNCSNNTLLLWVVVLATLVVMVYLTFWLSRGCCKVFKKRSMNRAAVSSLCVITLIYAVVVIGFSTSILVTQSDSNNDASSSDMGSTWYPGCGNGSDGGGSGSGNCSMIQTTNKTSGNTKQEACFEIQSQPFILSAAFLILLLVFVTAVVCSLGYEFSHNGFCYKKASYDPRVTVFEKETSFSS